MYVTPDPDFCEFDRYDEPRLHMEALMRVKLVEFDLLPLRLLLPLEAAGIKTVGDLTSRTRDQLAAIPQLGKKKMKILDDFLERYLLSLRK